MMQNADALGRRVRTAAPMPRAQRLVITEADHLLFEALTRHGPLPSSYLYEFTKHVRRDRSHLQNRLTEFYHGDGSGGLLTRPPQQFANYRARYQHVVYDLTPRSERLIAERGLGRLHRLRTDPFVHRLMGSCVGASLELCAPDHGLRHISLDEILSHAPCRAAKAGVHPLALPVAHADTATIIPDLLFGLHYPGTGYRFFAVEIDRQTESIERRNLRQSAFARKIAAYGSALREQTYRSWWGVPNLHILVVSTSVRHAENILTYVADHGSPECQARFAISAEPMFGADWRVPGALLARLLTEPWRTTTGTRDLARIGHQDTQRAPLL